METRLDQQIEFVVEVIKAIANQVKGVSWYHLPYLSRDGCSAHSSTRIRLNRDRRM
jgi:hypothetical protein